MKKLFLVSLLIVQSCMVFAQDCCVSDSINKQKTEPVFCYLNNEWIAGAYLDMVPTDSIQNMEVKNDEYGNRAAYLTVSPETVAEIKAELKKIRINLDPRVEFPGGNEKLKEWIYANLQVPEDYKGSERVVVKLTVLPDGSICNSEIFKASKNEAANAEALRLANALPKLCVQFCTPRKCKLKYYITFPFNEPGGML